MRKIIISGMIGNALEWYDYALYAQFSLIISNTFFGASEIKELLTFAVFALGFVIRPVGALIFSFVGDKLGRKAALSLSIFSMAVPTAVIGLLPGYDSIGITAPIILSIMRLLQGLSLGGEFSVCITYLVEHAQNNNRGLIGSASFVSMCIGMLFGSMTAWVMRATIDVQVLEGWAWRVPFILGLLISLVGLYIRRQLSESPVYIEARKHGQMSAAPVLETIKFHWRELLISMAIYVTVTAPFFTLTVYVESFLHRALGLDALKANIITAVGLMVMIFVMPLVASITDKIGRKPVLVLGAFGILLAAYPVFLAFGSGDFLVMIWAQVIFAIILASYMGCVPTVLVEMFPTRARLTGVALSYNLSAAIFGGTAPMVAILLVDVTGNKFAMGIYLGVLALMTFFIITKYFQETYNKALDN